MHWIRLLHKIKLLGHRRKCCSMMIQAQKFSEKKEVNLMGHLTAKMKLSGPITIYEYMKEVLTHPTAGYYMKKDAVGAKGDFITSPEITQMFGELMGIWVLNEWHKMGSPKPFQLIELGPGKGTMISDVLRVLKQFGVMSKDVEVHLVEKSPVSSELQAENLCIKSQKNTEMTSLASTTNHYQSGVNKDGSHIYWYTHLEDIPNKFSMVLAHEFFDALPVHRLRKTKEGWREILVDIHPEKGEHCLQYVLSREVPPSKMYLDPKETREELEVSPESGVIVNEIASRLERCGGAALVVDYGHEGTLSDTFRAFRSHKQVDPLLDPGSADLTADVDFCYLKRIISDRMITFGPIEQGFFLKNIGIDFRLQTLLRAAKNAEQKDNLITGHRMLTDRTQMGSRFKVLCFYPNVLGDHLNKYPPAGFTQIPMEE